MLRQQTLMPLLNAPAADESNSVCGAKERAYLRLSRLHKYANRLMMCISDGDLHRLQKPDPTWIGNWVERTNARARAP
jgi:hypothetical protein